MSARQSIQSHTQPASLPLIEFLEIMLLSREADKREAILFRQGRAKFHLPGAGHEAVGAIAYALEKEDVVYPYYRDRALMLTRGTSLYQLALDYFAKEESSSGGRQMASHYCDRDNNMVSCGTPTGMQCLPAVGTAWGIKLSGKRQVVICCIGDAATRQGEFYEALCFALQESLPIVFVVEDNGYGISTATNGMTPFAIDVLSKSHVHSIDGRNPEVIYDVAYQAIQMARVHCKPSVIWLELDRLMPHTSSDDHKTYRSKDELKIMDERDPLLCFANKLRASGEIRQDEWLKQCQETAQKVCFIYEAAEQAKNPEVQTIGHHIFSEKKLKSSSFSLTTERNWNMAEAVNAALRFLLEHNEKTILFGEDIADPKGGVFGLTKGLSSRFPDRVFNSPLAEATICGVAGGLSLTGNFIPVFELQFIDFVGPAFNQLVNQIATMRWRTLGRYTCPMVILAPCGGYLGCGGPWHSQTNEAWFAHAPGLKLAMPSDPDDAAEIITAAANGDDPTIILLPKNLFFKRGGYKGTPSLFPDQPKIRKQGIHVTVIAWGNCVDIALNAALDVEARGIKVEVIDPRFIVPCDQSIILSSLAKTSRLLIVQEDNRTCSFGQSLIADFVSRPEIWKTLKAPPRLISREDVHVGFHSSLEQAVLPRQADVVRSIFELVGST